MHIVERLRERDFCADSGAAALRPAEGCDPVVQATEAAACGGSGAAHAVVFDLPCEAIVGRSATSVASRRSADCSSASRCSSAFAWVFPIAAARSLGELAESVSASPGSRTEGPASG
jgi:hypothetical protein